MAEISGDQFLLLIIGATYLLITAIYALWMTRSGESLLREIRRDVPVEVWQAIGAPSSVRDAMKDSQKRWVQFIRARSYRNICSPITASKIDAYLQRASTGLFALAAAGGIILYRFWPLLKPAAFGD